jgi:hypothetical protein
MLAPRAKVSGGAAVVMAREKRSPQSGVRGRKRDAAPPEATRRNEIVEEIVDHLRPWKDRKDQGQVTVAVDHELDVVLKLAPMQAKLFDRAVNRIHARKLDSALNQVETLLASAPGFLAWYSFGPPPQPVTMTEDGLLMQAMPTTIEDVERQHRGRANKFVAELKRLRKVCARAADPEFGYHPNYDPAKHTCAWFARALMKELSDAKITGTKDGPFRTIASLIYEAISGKEEADLKRACDAVLQGSRNPELGTD